MTKNASFPSAGLDADVPTAVFYDGRALEPVTVDNITNYYYYLLLII